MKQYLDFEFIRAKSFKSIQPKDWSNLLIEQNFCCYYCCTDIRVIQELIFNGAINPRKRGVNGYSGFHFEIDHKNANKDDNSVSNIAAACYYCNNDKSNLFSSQIFKSYFGEGRKIAFETLLNHKGLSKPDHFRHHLA